MIMIARAATGTWNYWYDIDTFWF